MTTATTGTIPVISITADCLPEAWEKAVLAVWNQGFDVKTQYDKPEDPPSKDATVMITVTDPFHEPRIHKNFPGGPEELEAYRQEVVGGIHDHWVDPAAGKWTYTYHERLFSYCPVEDLRNAETPKPFGAVDQIQYVIDCLAQAGHSRRAGQLTLNMNTHWRSRDLYKAWFMNVYALTDLQRLMAEEISKKRGAPVRVGRYVDISDSLHIYGSYFHEATVEIEKMQNTPYTERAWESTHPAFEMMTQEAREKLAQDPDWFAKARG